METAGLEKGHCPRRGRAASRGGRAILQQRPWTLQVSDYVRGRGMVRDSVFIVRVDPRAIPASPPCLPVTPHPAGGHPVSRPAGSEPSVWMQTNLPSVQRETFTDTCTRVHGDTGAHRLGRGRERETHAHTHTLPSCLAQGAWKRQ